MVVDIRFITLYGIITWDHIQQAAIRDRGINTPKYPNIEETKKYYFPDANFSNHEIDKSNYSYTSRKVPDIPQSKTIFQSYRSKRVKEKSA